MHKKLPLIMEELLPLIGAFAALAFKVYSNFKKEQEKAKQRNFSRPEAPKAPQTDTWFPSTVDEPEVQRPYADFEQEVFNPQKPYEPAYPSSKAESIEREVVLEPRYERMRPEHVTTTDGKSPERPAEEVLRNRAIHLPHRHKFTPHEEESERSAYADFDMEDAVIKAAILNRPEW